MKALVDRQALVTALKVIQPAAHRSPGIPVLNGVRLTVDDDGLVITCTNLDLTISTRIEASNVTTGDAVPPLRLLTALLNVARSETALLSLDGSNLTVECGDTCATFRTFRIDEWPRTPLFPTENEVEMSADDLDGVGRIMHAVGHDPTQEYRRQCVHLNGNYAEATDSYRMARATLSCSGLPDVSIPNETVAAVLRAATGDVTVAHDGTRIAFRSGSTQWSSTLFSGDYYPLDRLIPPPAPFGLTFQRAELAAALSRVAVFSDKTPVVDIERDGDKAVLTACLIDEGEIVDMIPVAGDFDGRLRYDAAFLGQALDAHGGDEVSLEITEAGKPMAIRSDGLVTVLMPKRAGH